MKLKEIEEQINTNNKPYLKEIADTLFSKHAAIMIGAGFSKNAIPNSPYTNAFPDWNELGDAFFERLNGKKPDADNNYLNVLRLANEVEAAFGRPVLDSILLNSIPDLNHSPSELHKKLLNLPWTDVFTTNYDTLLERTAENIVDYKYTVVHNKDDLVGSSKPRIIKLHGSFPSDRPFIITEEDYRRYPHDFAPFVNTVQQSLLENTLCLVGFSGTDPNFLQWIGWIRDNLNKNVTKIYLIGVFSFSDAQIKLFAQRNIVVVNLDIKTNKGNKHYEALNLFVDYLQKQKNSNNPYDWPESTGCRTLLFHKSGENANPEELLNAALDSWKKQRLSYPGWEILPENKRNSFKYETNLGISNILKTYDKINKSLLFEFLYELLWRIDISLIAIPIELADIIEKAIHSVENNNKDLSFFYLKLMSCYRHLGESEKWNAINELFTFHQDEYPQEVVLKHKYEQVLNAIFHLDYETTRKHLSEWDIVPAFPFMNAKKAGILAEMGNVIEAESILRQALVDIRKMQNSSSNKCDWTLLSQESYIISLYQNIVFSYAFRNNNGTDYKEIQEKYSDRILFLQQKLCDPMHEGQYFKLLLSENYKPRPLEEEKYQFEINKKTYIRYFGLDSKPLNNAISFLIYSEKISQPFSINSSVRLNISVSEAIGAGERLCDYYLNWAVCVCFRIADMELAEKLFTRDRIAGFDFEYINTLCEKLLQVLEKNETYILQNETNGQFNFAKTLATILPEIISRLCCRCSGSVKERIFAFLKKVYTSQNRRCYINMDILLQRLMESFSITEKIKLFNDFLEIKIPETIYPVEEDKLLPAINFIDLHKNDIANKYKRNFSNKDLEKFYTASLSDNIAIRSWGIETLSLLFELDLLHDKQKEKFRDVLWSQTDNSTGFPANTHYCIFSFLNLPHPKDVDVNELFRQYLLQYTFPTYKNGIRIHSASDTVIDNFNEIMYSESLVKWNYDDFSMLLKKMHSFWEEGKNYINKDVVWGDSYILKRYISMKQAISILCRNISKINEQEQKIVKSLIDEFKEFKIPSLELQVACFFSEKNQDSIAKEIKYAWGSDDDYIVQDALRAFYSILKFYENNKTYSEISNTLWNTFANVLLYKRDKSLVICLNYLANLYIKKYFDFVPYFAQGNLLFVLKALSEETDIRKGNASLETELKLSIRRNCACAAYNLYTSYLGKSQEIPSEITVWKEICSSENEFAEIRNEWREK